MPDKKLTDNEIIKEVESFKSVDDNDITRACIERRLLKEVYLLINRLQAENEKLTEENKKLSRYEGEILKEFAERLKAEYADFDEKHEVILPENIHKAIDDLLKEMVGEDK